MQNKSTHPSLIKSLPLEYITNILSIYLCSTLVLIGILGNLISFYTSLKYSVKTSHTFSQKTLVLLTISNSMYLVLFWYYSILPKLINNFELNKPVNVTRTNGTILNEKQFFSKNIFVQLYRINMNVLLCKSISYFISITIFINSSITTLYSLERAIAINLPFKVRNLREKHRSRFRIVIFLVIMYSILFPSYNLIITNLVKNENNRLKCDIPLQYESLYFKLTIAFVVQTLGLPFFLITLSNISILFAIERNRKNFHESKYIKNSNSSFNQRIQVKKASLECCKVTDQSKEPKETPILRNENRPMLKYLKKNADSCKSGHDPITLMRIRKKFFIISACFVLLNLPYFISWFVYSYYRINMTKPFKPGETKILSELFNLVKMTEVLNLCNYSITGFLYLTTRKLSFCKIIQCK
jgi:hypothetical protein